MHQNHCRDISWYKKSLETDKIHYFLTIFVSLLYVSDMIAIMPDGSCSCLVCGTAFTSKKNANRHFKEKHTVNREIPEPCYICGKQMRRVRNLVDHLWSIHKISHRQIRAWNASSSKTFPPILPHLQWNLVSWYYSHCPKQVPTKIVRIQFWHHILCYLDRVSRFCLTSTTDSPFPKG